jgi:cobalt/nickel transport system permease protein
VIPRWLVQSNPPAEPSSGGSGSASFLEKTINTAAAFIAETVLCDAYANRPGLLQRIDPRCKLAALLALIGAVSLLHSPQLIWAVCFLSLVLAFRSDIAPRLFIGRVAPCVFFFGILIALPAIFNIITPGEPFWLVADLGHSRQIGPYTIPARLFVTRQGLFGGVVFIGRVAASVSLALLLPLTTRWNELIRACAALRVPQLFVLVLAMAYRYIALLVRTVAELHEARQSRTVHYLPAGAEQRWVAARIGYLFGKSYRLSQDVHDAMLARGFAGEVVSAALPKASGRDFLWLSGALLIAAALVVLDRIG